MTDQFTDGNALAGPFMDIFAVDLSMAQGTCAHCGMHGMVAQMHVYDHAPGLVVRCPSCEQVNMRLVRGPDRAWLDMRGVVALEIPLAAPAERA
jgi:Zn finger protein HypA/HybF involved in hydrogenase expression